jgi:hypothetical protein
MAASTTTTSIVLNWTAAGGANSTGQQVQRSAYNANSYSTIATLNATATTYTDTTAIIDTVYDYRIVNICEVGGPTNGGRATIVDITCPTITTNVSGLIISGEHGETTNDSEYESIKLLNQGEDELQALNITGNQAGPYAFTDAGVDYDTTYIVRAVIIAPDGTTKNCDTSVSTGAAPSCDAPTNLTVAVVQS